MTNEGLVHIAPLPIELILTQFGMQLDDGRFQCLFHDGVQARWIFRQPMKQDHIDR
jgi:hypothetical protein